MSLRRKLRKLSRTRPLMAWYAFRSFAGLDGPVEASRTHLLGIAQWLCRAQDSSPDGGVSAAYSMWDGWLPSYPETTGYIAESFLSLAGAFQDPLYLDRAKRMCDWEIEAQLPSGAVVAGYYDRHVATPPPAVFNTGQVILGWCAAYHETGQEAYLEAALRAGDWLIEMNDPGDGAWYKGLSPLYSGPATSVRTYNSRAAWALLELSHASGISRYREVGLRNLDWVLAQRTDNHWFRNCGFTVGQDPLSHTINYVIEGLLGAFHLVPDQRFLEAARGTLDKLGESYDREERLSATFNENWEATAKYSCLTGNAQFARNLYDLSLCMGERKYAARALRVTRQLKGYQLMGSANPNIRGSLPGSHPIYGGYGAFEFNSWTAKFFLDALLLEMRFLSAPSD